MLQADPEGDVVLVDKFACN